MTPWLEIFTPRPLAKMRLFCFPHAGGAALVFRQFGKKLPTDIEVCPVQYPGRWGRISEPPYREWRALLTELLPELTPRLEEKPFALFGHSMGGLIAFELARALRNKGGPLPTVLLVSAFRPPQLGRLSPHTTFELPPEKFLERIQKMEGTPQELIEHPEMFRIFLPILRADMELVETYAYQPGEKLDCPIIVFGGVEDREVPLGDMGAWAELTHRDMKLVELPGGHFFFRSHEDLLLEKIKEELGPIVNDRKHDD